MEQKKININGIELLAVEVPEGATNFESDGEVLMYDTKATHSGMGSKLLPQGNYEIIGLVGQLTREQCEGIMGKTSFELWSNSIFTTYMAVFERVCLKDNMLLLKKL